MTVIKPKFHLFKKIGVYLLGLFLIILLLFNQFTKMKYDLNLYEFYIQSQPLTEDEKQIIMERGTMTYASDKNAPPLSFVEIENGQYRGLIIDYASSLSIELGADFIIQPMIWEEALNDLIKGNIDIVDVFESDERKQYLSFSKPIYKLRGVVLVSEKNKYLTKIADLFGRTVAIQKGDYAKEHIDDNFPLINYILTEDIEEGIDLLEKGIVDGIIGDEPVINYFVIQKNLDNSTYLLDDLVYEKDVVLAVRKSDEYLLDIYNKAIFSLKKMDYVTKIQQRWFGIAVPIEKNIVTDDILVGGLLIFFISISIASLMALLVGFLKSELSKRNEELSNSKNELEKTFNSLNQFIIILNEKGIIQNCNKPFIEFVQYDKDSIVGTHYINKLFLKNYNTIVESYLYQGEDSMANFDIQIGNRIYSNSLTYMNSEPNSIKTLLLVIQDISELRTLESKLNQKNKMEAIGQLAAGMAHEIRNPLGIIRTYGYLFKKYLLTNEGIEHLAILEESVNRIDKLITNLLDFSRLTGDQLSNIHLKTFIDKTIELMKLQKNHSNIEYNIECEDNLVILSNSELLKHVLINLIENAINAIKLEDGRIDISSYKDELNTYIIVKDNGNGIIPEDLKNIFNPFFTTNSSNQGTGLGLYIVYNEIQRLNGEVLVESTYKKGSKFTIVLPEGS